MRDLARLILRLVFGGLVAGHGAQKLFGWFEGPGLGGTEKMVSSMGLKPADKWALAAAGSEFAGGTLTALGFLSPLGPLAVIAPMTVATTTVHADKPIWASKGGAELAVTNLAIAGALFLAGPGVLSLDTVLRTKVPWWLSGLAILGTAGGIMVAIDRPKTAAAKPAASPAKPANSAPKPVEKAAAEQAPAVR
ncbi:MAG: hypothetical protein NVS1B1_11300 [Candidatus Limnocylindrales bacterium]